MCELIQKHAKVVKGQTNSRATVGTEQNPQHIRVEYKYVYVEEKHASRHNKARNRSINI